MKYLNKKTITGSIIALGTASTMILNFGANDSLKLKDIQDSIAKDKNIEEAYKIDNEKFIKNEDQANDKFKIKIGENLKPNLEISKWDEESKLILKPRSNNLKAIDVKDKKIEYDDGNTKYRFYDIEEKLEYEKIKDKSAFIKSVYAATINEDIKGFEMEIELSEAPENDILELDIESENIIFEYQAPLNIEFSSSTCTETQCGDWYRPENIVGSYSLYNASNRNHEVGKTNYMAGKISQMYRPKIIDANGDEFWGIYNTDLNETKVLQIKIPKGVVYPIIVDPTFGYESIGGSTTHLVSNTAGISLGTPITSGTVIKYYLYTSKYGSDTCYTKPVIWKYSDKSIVGIFDQADCISGYAWREFSSFSSPILVEASTDYWVGHIGSFGAGTTYSNLKYDSSSSGGYSSNSFSSPNPLGTITTGYIWSQYAEYAADGVITDDPTNVTATSTTLNSTPLFSDEDAMDLFFEYGTSSGVYTATTTLTFSASTTSSFSDTITGLDYLTTYYFRAGGIGTTTASGTLYYYGNEKSTTTLDLDPVETDGATSINKNSATLNGNIQDLGNESSFHVGFIYGIGSFSATSTGQTISSVTSFNESISGLTTLSYYQFKAFATASSGGLWYGNDVYYFYTADVSSTTDTDAEWNIGTFSTSSVSNGWLIMNPSSSGALGASSTESFESVADNTTVDSNSDYHINTTDSTVDNCWRGETTDTPSGSTGATDGQDGTVYAYTETSSGYCYTAGDISIMEHDGIGCDIGCDGMVCFYYNFYGSTIGTMKTQYYDESAASWIDGDFSLTGQQDVDGTTWNLYCEDFPDTDISGFRFHYTAAGDFYGDASIDNIQIATGTALYASSSWLSMALSVGAISAVDDSKIEWASTTPANTGTNVYALINTSSTTPSGTWDAVNSGGSIPDATGDLSGKYLWVKIDLDSYDSTSVSTVDWIRYGINDGGTPPATSTPAYSTAESSWYY